MIPSLLFSLLRSFGSLALAWTSRSPLYSYNVCVLQLPCSSIIFEWRISDTSGAPNLVSTMATVHPSRMGLVPQDHHYPDRRRARSRSRSPRNRSPTRPERNGDHQGERHRSGDRYRHGGSDRDKYGSRARSRERSSDRRTRDDESRGRDRERDGRDHQDKRRASPEYTDYKRTSPGPAAPWRQQENMYPNRSHRDRPPHGYGDGSTDYMDRYVFFFCKQRLR